MKAFISVILKPQVYILCTPWLPNCFANNHYNNHNNRHWGHALSLNEWPQWVKWPLYGYGIEWLVEPVVYWWGIRPEPGILLSGSSDQWSSLYNKIHVDTQVLLSIPIQWMKIVALYWSIQWPHNFLCFSSYQHKNAVTGSVVWLLNV